MNIKLELTTLQTLTQTSLDNSICNDQHKLIKNCILQTKEALNDKNKK